MKSKLKYNALLNFSLRNSFRTRLAVTVNFLLLRQLKKYCLTDVRLSVTSLTSKGLRKERKIDHLKIGGTCGMIANFRKNFTATEYLSDRTTRTRLT
jgi:hypothetical protein